MWQWQALAIAMGAVYSMLGRGVVEARNKAIALVDAWIVAQKASVTFTAAQALVDQITDINAAHMKALGDLREAHKKELDGLKKELADARAATSSPLEEHSKALRAWFVENDCLQTTLPDGMQQRVAVIGNAVRLGDVHVALDMLAESGWIWQHHAAVVRTHRTKLIELTRSVFLPIVAQAQPAAAPPPTT